MSNHQYSHHFTTPESATRFAFRKFRVQRAGGDQVAHFRHRALLGRKRIQIGRRRKETLEGGLAFIQQPRRRVSN